MTSPIAERSPWQAALGDRFATLDPRLGAYFGLIPAGSQGNGSGVFEVVGTPRRWLWPVLAMLGRAGIAFPVWEREVPFTVVNAAAGDAVAARRVFHFSTGESVMIDSISHGSEGLVDRMGRRGRLVVRLEPSVIDGELRLRSTRVTMLGMPVPSFISPRVSLTERFDPMSDRQRVSLVIDAPVVGRLYEYSGSFTYSVAETS